VAFAGADDKRDVAAAGKTSVLTNAAPSVLALQWQAIFNMKTYNISFIASCLALVTINKR